MGIHIRCKVPGSLHLDYKEYISLIPFLHRPHKFFYMLHGTLAGCIREPNHSSFFQRNPFHLNQNPTVLLSFFRLHIQVNSGIPISIFWTDFHSAAGKPIRLPAFQPFFHRLIGNLRVHINKLFILLHSNQIPLRLSLRIL